MLFDALGGLTGREYHLHIGAMELLKQLHVCPSVVSLKAQLIESFQLGLYLIVLSFF